MPSLMTLQGPNLGTLASVLRRPLQGGGLMAGDGTSQTHGLIWLALGGLAVGAAVAYRMDSRSPRKSAAVGGYQPLDPHEWARIERVVRKIPPL